MSKYVRVADSYFCPETGLSIVWLNTPLGVFKGEAQCADVDKEHMSRFFGCEIAELRARSQYFNAEKNRLKIANKTIMKYMTNLQIPLSAKAFFAMEKDYLKNEESIQKFADTCTKIREIIKDKIEERDKHYDAQDKVD